MLHGKPDALDPDAPARLDKTVAEVTATGLALVEQKSADRGKQELTRYGAEHWNAAKVDKEIATAADWGVRHNVPLWCGEFGVYKRSGRN